MTDANPLWNRLSTIATLAENAPENRKPGHTAIMKFIYFLQALRNVPLGYDFRLHIYGPFDQDVLNDLSYAEFLEAVTSKTVLYPTSYGYEVRSGPAADNVKALASKFLAQHSDDIDWVIQQFGSRSAAELEMIGTIIYVDRRFSQRGQRISLENLALRVEAVKPHLTVAQIQSEVQSLQDKGLLKGVSG